MSSNSHIPQPGPTPLCASFAGLLPVLDEPGIDAGAAAAARAHLATCPYCQRQRAAYEQLEVALRRYLGPSATPRPRTEDIMRTVLGDKDHLHEPGDSNISTPPTPLPDAPRPRRSRRVAFNLVALAAALVLALLAGAFFSNLAHTHVTGPQNTPTAISTAPRTPIPTSTPVLLQGDDTELNAVSMVSPAEGWAAGYINFTSHEVAVLMHDADGVWSEVQPGNGRLVSISMDAANDGWAVGDQGLMLHYNGLAWQRVTTPIQDSLTAVQMLSPSDGWLVSGSGGIWHYNGRVWAAQPLPGSLHAGTQNDVQLYGLSMLSTGEGWAVGIMQPKPAASAGMAGYARFSSGQGFTGVILHYKNGQWAVQQTFSHAAIYSISMDSADDGWVVGSAALDAGVAAPFLAHYTQGRWVQAANPLGNARSDIYGFTRVAMVSAAEGWITTLTQDKSAIPVLLHYTGARWVSVSLPALPDTRTVTLSGIAMLSAAEGWVVGARYATPQAGSSVSKVVPLLLHYLDGAWSAAPGS